MGPVSAKSYPGRDLVRPQPPPAGRARQEIDYGRRGKGYIFGAFCPATGAAFTRPYPGRGTAHWVAFLEEVEGWLPQEVERVYAGACCHHYPGGIAGCVSRSLRRRRRPSPLLWRVGSHIDCFEACSVFTRVAARTVR